MKLSLYPISLYICIAITANAQEQMPDITRLKAVQENKVLEIIGKKSNRFVTSMQKKAERQLNHLMKQERRLRNKVERKDSALAARIFDDSPTKYQQFFGDSITGRSGSLVNLPIAYTPYLDSIRTVLSFLNANNPIKQSIANVENRIPPVLKKLDVVQENINRSEAINRYLDERQQYLSENLVSLGLLKEMKGLVKKVKLYKLKANEYKSMLQRPALLEAKLLALVAQKKAFTDFFNKHSQLASLFRLLGTQSVQEPSIPGLQTRQLLQQEAYQRLGRGSELSQMTQQQATGSSGALPNLKDKLSGMESKDAGELPVGNINSSRAKTFLQRLELGSNFQNTSSSAYFPSMTDVGLSVAYRINEKCIAGLGGSGKVGWGKDIRHIVVTGQGASLRSFAEIRIKGTFHAAGAFEMNYNKPFSTMQHLYGMKDWSQSGLVGISRTVPLSSKIVKGTKLMLLWDFLSYQQVPRRPAFNFRIGYNFK